MSGIDRAGDVALTVDLAIFTIHDGVFSVLLVQRGAEPFAGQWALPGGFVQPAESVEPAAWRLLAAETGLPRFPGHLEQLRTYGDAGRDPRMRVVSVAHLAFAPDLPDPTAEWGHDPHCMRMHPAAKDVVYQQNHCGIYKLDRAAGKWNRIGANMPKEVGDIGFPVVLHPRDPKTLWVFPMDGTTVWPRMSVAGKPAVYRSRDAGATWQRQADGLPPAHAWFTVKRQAMSADQQQKVGLYFGTTCGEVWASFDEGSQWQCLMLHLPHIYSVEAYTL